jgi:hypothetical protein
MRLVNYLYIIKMATTNDSSFTNIEWETVRSKKGVGKPSKEHKEYKEYTPRGYKPKDQSPRTNNAELNENYVPKPIRDDIDEIVYSSNSTYEKIRDLNKKINGYVKYRSSKDIDWRKRLNIYIIYESCKNNKHEIIASILDNCPDYTIYTNAISSTKSGNNCLFDAAYFGSDIVVNYLLNRNANIHHKNKLGETIYEIIEAGRLDAFERYPKAKKTLGERFDECIRLVKQVEDAEKAGLKASEVLEDVVAIEGGGGAAAAGGGSSEYPSEYTLETLKEDVLKYIETPSEFRKFVVYLKANNFTELLVSVLEDEEMEDILIDNPYVAKLV